VKDMILTATQRTLIERLINTIETGTPDGDYGNISIFADGPHDIRQITYGRAQTTEYGNLRQLIVMYSGKDGIHSKTLKPYIDRIGSDPLVNDTQFKKILREAGRKDPIMREIQDQFFEKVYFAPAMKWADDNGFSMALSALVIYDSFIHSGQILWQIRNMFEESPPAKGGNEKTWIRDYVNARHNWLANHPRKILHNTVYRTQAFKEQISKGNWDLKIVPVLMNGTDVFP
jgi:chitosanase